jgi:hypothetical protein
MHIDHVKASNVHMKTLHPDMLIAHAKQTILRLMLVLLTLSVVCGSNLI